MTKKQKLLKVIFYLQKFFFSEKSFFYESKNSLYFTNVSEPKMIQTSHLKSASKFVQITLIPPTFAQP